MRLITFFLLCIFISTGLYAQFRKGVKYYDNYLYEEAVPHLEKSLTGENSREATEKLAHSLRILKKYEAAGIYYRRLLELEDPPNSAYYYYGEVLMSTAQYEEAAEKFNKYVLLEPGDPHGQLMVQALAELKRLQTSAPYYEIRVIKELNTGNFDFAPVLWGDKLFYVSEAAPLVAYTTPVADAFSDLRLSIFFSSPDPTDPSRYLPGEQLRGPITSTGLHSGPAAISPGDNSMVFTSVKSNVKKNKVEKPQLYIAAYKNKHNWKSPKPFEHNIDGYSTAYPAFSQDGKTLYFASDRPGSRGGYDIFQSKLINGKWSEPENLGDTINTPLNEIFPSCATDGSLYFSSEGHPGLGGMDLFKTAFSNGSWSRPKNLLSPLNSPADDFGITFDSTGRSGYFSSNRNGGAGKDDIYGFLEIPESKRGITIKGRMMLDDGENIPAGNVKLLLVTSDGQVITSTMTDKTGHFKFEHLDPDINYLVRMEGEDTELLGNASAWREDSETGNFSEVEESETGSFIFYQLPSDNNQLTNMEEEDTFINISGSLLSGEESEDPVPMADQKVQLTDAEGNVIAEGVTDQFGNFVFKKLPPDKNYLIRIAGEDTKLNAQSRIILKDDKGLTVVETSAGDGGNFIYEMLAHDTRLLQNIEAEDTRITISGSLLSGENGVEEVAGQKVLLTDEDGTVVAEGITDRHGNFVFKELPPDINYMVRIDEKDTRLKPNTRVVITDNTGKAVAETVSGPGGELNYEVSVVESVTLKNDINESSGYRINMKGNIYSDKDEKTPLAGSRIFLMDAEGRMVQEGMTDSLGKFEFRNLPSEDTYWVTVPEEDVPPHIRELYIAAENGTIIRKILFGENGFNFQLLPSDKDQMSSLYLEDPTLLTKIQDPAEEITATELTGMSPEIIPDEAKPLVIELENIYYPLAGYSLPGESTAILDKAVNLLEKDPSLIIEIRGHADARASDQFNLQLSQQRAGAARDYLLSKGISRNRITSRGYGEQNPVNECADGVVCTEDQHAKNRRTEMTISSAGK